MPNALVNYYSNEPSPANPCLQETLKAALDWLYQANTEVACLRGVLFGECQSQSDMAKPIGESSPSVQSLASIISSNAASLVGDLKAINNKVGGV